MTSIGDSDDNALALTINGLFKTEVVRRRGPWRGLEAIELATLEWVDGFNPRRLLEPFGNVAPVEAEASITLPWRRSTGRRKKPSETASGNPGAVQCCGGLRQRSR